MRILTTPELADRCGGRLVGPRREVGPAVVIDSRRAEPGSLFVAIPGENVDGHDFVADAAARGAAAALVTRPVLDVGISQIVCEDAVDGLTRLATALVAAERERGLITAGITGSSGKTTTKDILAQLLERLGSCVSPVASFNNEIGGPLTACGVDDTTRFLVMEMGAQWRGEIASLCRVTPPDIGVVLNVGHAHLGYFGSREGIAQAKGELVEVLPRDGFAVLNYDDPLVWGMRDRTVAQVVACGVGRRPDHDAAVWASDVVADPLQRCAFQLHADLGFARGTCQISLPLVGRHVVADAVEAAASALVAGASLGDVAAGLDALVPRSRWRMEVHELPGGITVINDAYNANPDSVEAGARTVLRLAEARRAQGRPARTWFLFGDMLELGDESADLHRTSGAVAAPVDEIVAVGQFATDFVAGAGHGQVAANADAAAELLNAGLREGDIVLIKGSNSTGLGRVGDSIVARAGGAA